MQVHWRGTTPTPWFERAVRRRNLPRLELALASGAAPAARDARLETSLHYCARQNWLEGLHALLSARADANACSVFQRTPLLEAALAGHTGAAELLLEANADVNYQGGRGWEQHACALVKIKEFRAALHCAAHAVDAELVRLLLKRSAAVDRLDGQGATALRLALLAENRAACSVVVALLLEARANPNPPINCHHKMLQTPLHIAAYNADADVTVQLLAALAEPDGAGKGGGLTPLMVAVKKRTSGHLTVVSSLLASKASPAITAGRGKTALDLAILNKAPPEVVAALTAVAETSKLEQVPAPIAKGHELPQIVLDTEMGKIVVSLRADAAPVTVAHVSKLVEHGLFDGCCFYRSDIVLQFGMQRPDGTRFRGPFPALSVNETAECVALQNRRGTLALAHRDIPDCGNSDIFINLQSNLELDTVGGGYCVFGEIADHDEAFTVVTNLATAVANGERPVIHQMKLKPLVAQLERCDINESARSGNCTFDSMDVNLTASYQCPNCCQRFATEDMKERHWKIIHDPNCLREE